MTKYPLPYRARLVVSEKSIDAARNRCDILTLDRTTSQLYRLLQMESVLLAEHRTWSVSHGYS